MAKKTLDHLMSQLATARGAVADALKHVNEASREYSEALAWQAKAQREFDRAVEDVNRPV